MRVSKSLNTKLASHEVIITYISSTCKLLFIRKTVEFYTVNIMQVTSLGFNSRVGNTFCSYVFAQLKRCVIICVLKYCTVPLKVSDLVDVTASVLQVWPQSLLHLGCTASETEKL